ncbi:MAG: flagellar biosynthesis anti-sigma factor FlgM [Fimbriimonadaceae bacterium]|nr:flagellar biosynthesis anti-sigma factor FlgM [Fimbriimonadaceae bacterium]
MIISREECQHAVKRSARESARVDNAVIRLVEADVITSVTANVNHMPDREDRVRELRAQVESGTYHRTGEEIAVAMGRRALADRIR